MDVHRQKKHWTEAREEMAYLRRRPMGLLTHYHFVGIGGCGMSALAQMLHQRQHHISGSDQKASAVTDRLKSFGIEVHIGHDADCLPEELDGVVISAAVKEDNPELQAARRRGVQVFKYAELLGELTRHIPTFAVAGTHGKSTTSGWLAYMLRDSRLDPAFVVGAEVCQLSTASDAGGGQMLVVEACEYDRSFLNFHPKAGAILNIESDHLDYYQDLNEIIHAFTDFARRIDDKGLLIFNGDDPGAALAGGGARCRTETFSLDRNSDWHAGHLEFDQGRGVFDLVHHARSLGRVRLGLAGRHNVANALAVAALASHAKVPDDRICSGLETFTGVGRRMALKGKPNNITILDDYAHHPTEIRVTLAAIRDRYQPNRLWCVFQPHQHSRTRFLLNEFALSFDSADVVLLPEIYFVRDSDELRQTVTAEQLAEKLLGRGRDARYLGDFEAILETLRQSLAPGDLVVTMGAGNIGKLADELIQRL